jgi:hypothetical protein
VLVHSPVKPMIAAYAGSISYQLVLAQNLLQAVQSTASGAGVVVV